MKKALEEAAATDGIRIVVDMTETAFCDSAGLRALIDGAQTAEQRGRSLIVVPPVDSHLRRVFDLLALYDVLEVVGTLDEAKHPPAAA